MPPNETNLHAREARDGSEESFVRLYERVSPALMAWARLRTAGALGRVVDADDVLQETWWRALESFDTFDDSRRFRGWIFGIAGNVLHQMAARRPSGRLAAASPGEGRRRVELSSELRAQLTSITVRSRRRDRVDELVARLAELPDVDKRLFVQRGIERRSLAEVGATLKISEDAARMRWARLRERLEGLAIVQEIIEGDERTGA